MSLITFCIPVVVIICLTSQVCAYAQHPGAYSSPQYAKKSIQYNQNYNHPRTYSEPEYEKITTQEHDKNTPNAERSKHHEIDITDYSKQDILQFKNFSNHGFQLDASQGSYQNVENNDLIEYAGNETQTGRSAGFMETAGNFLSGRGGQMLADIARELITRSTGASSQVLSLNLTNLVILVVLKALILAAGMFGAGAWHQGYARSLDGDSNSAWINDEELALWHGYLHRGEADCLQMAACENPILAKRYSGGADLLLTTAKLFEKWRMEITKLTPDHWTSQFLTGHGGFTFKLRQLGLRGGDNCLCGETQDANHILWECPHMSVEREELLNSDLVSTRDNFLAFKKFAASYGEREGLFPAALPIRSVPYDAKYEKILEDVKEAAAWGSAGMKCNTKYKCSKKETYN